MKCKGFSEEHTFTLDSTFASKLFYIYSGGIDAKFKENCLIQDDGISSTIFYFEVNSFIFFKLDTLFRDLNADFTLGDCLFDAVNSTKNADLDKCGLCYWI